ncbi:MAG: tRNA pseudouridine(55) synthase TruB, partial [Chloroflexota bacterium]|nr:tRNA pseudouridine(55) synthase TruB [Chloroflexota bacterium]
EVVLGATTATDDAEAPLLQARDTSGISRADIEAVLPRFIGDVAQIPPAYAAVRQGGEKMYALARRGIVVDAPPRQVTVHGITIEAWSNPRLRLLIRCGPGTYIRSLARDLGEALTVGGYLHALRRLSSGAFSIEDAHTLESLEHIEIHTALLPPDRAVAGWSAAVLSPEEVVRVQRGQAIVVSGCTSGNVRLYGSGGLLVALAECRDMVARPFRVFSLEGPCAGGD